MNHTCIKDDGGTPNRKCYACEDEKRPPLKLDNVFSTEELIELSKWLDHQYLPYDNEEIHNVVRKIQRIVSEYELARKSGSPTQGS